MLRSTVRIRSSECTFSYITDSCHDNYILTGKVPYPDKEFMRKTTQEFDRRSRGGESNFFNSAFGRHLLYVITGVEVPVLPLSSYTLVVIFKEATCRSRPKPDISITWKAGIIQLISTPLLGFLEMVLILLKCSYNNWVWPFAPSKPLSMS